MTAPHKPHVVVFNQAALPLGMAGGTRHVELFERLEGWDATILAGNKSYLDQRPVHAAGSLVPVRVTRFSGNGPSRVLNWISYMISALVAGFRGPRPAVVWGSSPQMGAAVSALLLSRFRRVPFVLEIRDLWPHILVEADVIADNGVVHRAIRRLEEFLYRSAAAIVVLAEGTQRELADRGFDNGKVHFIPNGADLAAFDVRTDRSAVRASLKLEDDDLAIVYAGAHGSANGLHFVIDAAEELIAEDSNAVFVLIGDGPHKAELVALAQARGLDNVRFVDPVPKGEIPHYYAAADAGLHCLEDVSLFKYGVSPNKLYDYMAAGLPVITNAGGEVAAMVAQSGSGEAVSPAEISVGVREIERLTVRARRELGRNGREFMTEHRSRTILARTVENLLESLAGSRS